MCSEYVGLGGNATNYRQLYKAPQHNVYADEVGLDYQVS